MIISIRSNTILETVVALVIILAVFGAATRIIVSVTSASMSVKRLTAEQLLKAYAENTERQKQFYDADTLAGRFRIKRTIVTGGSYPNLCQIHYAIYDTRDSLLAQWQGNAITQ